MIWFKKWRRPTALITIVAAALGVSAWLILDQFESDICTRLGNDLTAKLNTTHQAVVTLLQQHQAAVRTWANTSEVRMATSSLLTQPRDRQALFASSVQIRLRDRLDPVLSQSGYQGYFIIGPDYTNLASSRDQHIGHKNFLISQKAFFQRIWSGKTAVSLPEKSAVPLPDKDGHVREGLPIMFVGAPVIDVTGKVLAAFAFRVNPAGDFSTILHNGHIGKSGESYAFDRHGVLISKIHTIDQLRDIGLIDKSEEAILNLQLIDPGINLVQGDHQTVTNRHPSLTLMARKAITGESGLHLDGYRDYRGVPVVGAWLWDDDLGFGITAELDFDEAYQALHLRRYVVIGLTVFLVILFAGLTMIYLVYWQRRQAEDALRKSEERLRLLLGQAEFVLWATDMDLKFTQSLGGGLSGLGLRTNEIVEAGLDLYQFFQTDSPDFLPIKSHYEALQGRHVKFDIEWQDRHYQCEVTPQKDSEERIIGCIGVAVDISERKRAEQALQRTDVLELLAKGASLNDVLTALVLNAEKHTPGTFCSILLLDEDGKHLRLGAAPSLPDFYNKMIDGVEVGPEVGSCGAAASAGERVIVEDIRSHPNCKDYLALAEKAGLAACWSEPVISFTGDVLGTFAIYYDKPCAPSQSDLEFIQDSARLAGITIEHELAQDALSKSERRYRLVVQQQTDLICRFTQDFTLAFVNDAYCRYFGKTETELLGMDFFSLIPEEARQAARQHFASFTPERSVQVQQHPVITPDGSQRWQQWTNQAFFDESGKLMEFQAVGTDITELKQAEEKTQELLKQNRQLTRRLFQAQEEERRHLARELHDEFGQWLTAIHLNARTMIDRYQGSKDDTYESAKAIDESVTHMHASIRSILRSLRPPLLDELGLTDSLRELVDQWQEQYPAVGCELAMEDALDDLGDVMKITVYRIVQEALNNIAKHAEANHVLISLKLESIAGSHDKLDILLEDDGKGMDIEQSSGGFGLAGMRERVLAVGGEFAIHSPPEKGVCIAIQLPVTKQQKM